jgi:hypothetical protein
VNETTPRIDCRLPSGAKLIGSESHVRLDMPKQKQAISPHLHESLTENIYGSKE